MKLPRVKDPFDNLVTRRRLCWASAKTTRELNLSCKILLKFTLEGGLKSWCWSSQWKDLLLKCCTNINKKLMFWTVFIFMFIITLIIITLIFYLILFSNVCPIVNLQIRLYLIYSSGYDGWIFRDFGNSFWSISRVDSSLNVWYV